MAACEQTITVKVKIEPADELSGVLLQYLYPSTPLKAIPPFTSPLFEEAMEKYDKIRYADPDTLGEHE